METRICTRCGEEKDKPLFVTYFDNRRNKEYTRGYCRQCENTATKQRFVESPELLLRAKIRAKKYRSDPDNKKKIAKYHAQHGIDNAESIAAQKKEYRLRPDVAKREKLRGASYYAKNKDDIQKKRAKYYIDNPDKKEKRNQRIRDNYSGNTEYHVEKSSRRRRNIKQATPSWYDEKAMIRLRKIRNIMKKAHNVSFHLDHIVPINGKNVCGLHWHGNIQIITSCENLKKSNKYTG